MELGPDANAQWTFSILLGTAVVGAVTFYFSQREQHLLIAKELASKQRAEAETRYRILADNAVDIIVHFRGGGVAWISPSVEPALGGPLSRWTGTDFARRIHPEDRDKLQTALRRIAGANRCSNASGCVPSTANTTGSTVMGSPTPMPRATPMG